MVPWILLGFHLRENSKEQSKWFIIEYFLLHSANVNFVLSLQGEVTSPSTPAAKHTWIDHQLLFCTRRPRVHIDTTHHWGTDSGGEPISKCYWVRLWQSSCTRRQQQFVLQNSEDQHMAGWCFCPGYLNTYFVHKNFSIFVLFPLSAYLSSLKILWRSDLPLIEMNVGVEAFRSSVRSVAAWITVLACIFVIIRVMLLQSYIM